MPPRKLAEHERQRSGPAPKPSIERGDGPVRRRGAQSFLIEGPGDSRADAGGGPIPSHAQTPGDAPATGDAPAPGNQQTPGNAPALGSIGEARDRLQALQRASLEISARTLDLASEGGTPREGHLGELLALQADLARQQAEMAAIVARISAAVDGTLPDGETGFVGSQAGRRTKRGTRPEPQRTDRVLVGLLAMILALTLVLAGLVYVLATGVPLEWPFAPA